ncbi:MAG: squalene/phytoene synthase family protein [Pseudomonadota bacterium]
MSAACAQIVARDDPRLHATAMFAPEPARSALMVLYAFDCELSRATSASKESLIPRMRLQWWREMINAASNGAPPRAHEVAAPLAEMLMADSSEKGPTHLTALVDAHEKILDLPWSEMDYAAWRTSRFHALMSAAALWLTQDGTSPPEMSWLADAAALRNAHRMAKAGGQVMVSGISGPDLASFARGEMTDLFATKCREIAEHGLADLERARAAISDDRLLPVLLPTMWAERELRSVNRNPAVVLTGLEPRQRPFDGMRLLVRAMRRHW